jgi:hypothetical protein
MNNVDALQTRRSSALVQSVFNMPVAFTGAYWRSDDAVVRSGSSPRKNGSSARVLIDDGGG